MFCYFFICYLFIILCFRGQPSLCSLALSPFLADFPLCLAWGSSTSGELRLLLNFGISTAQIRVLIDCDVEGSGFPP